MTAALKPAKRRKKPNLVKEADVVFSKIVRSIGMCESGRPDHAGSLQCAHGFSRRYKNVRWDRRQCWCLCQGCHVFYTHRPIEWDLWMRRQMGEPLYLEVRRLALSDWRPDVQQVLAQLKAEWKAISQ